MLILKATYQKLDRVIFSPDGRGIGALGQKAAFWWDLTPGRLGKPLKSGEGAPWGLAFDPSGRWMFSSTGKGRVRVLDTHTGSETVPGPFPRPVSIAASSLEPILVTATATPYYPDPVMPTGWRLGADGTLTQIWTRTLQYRCDGLWFSRDGTRVVIRTHDHATGGESILLHPDTGKVDLTIPNPAEDLMHPDRYSPDGSLFFTAPDNYIELFPRPSRPGPIPRIVNDNRKQFMGVRFHPSGKYIVAASNDQTVKVSGLFHCSSCVLLRRSMASSGRTWNR